MEEAAPSSVAQPSSQHFRIAVLLPESLRRMGGYEVFFYNLLIRLHAHGHQIDVYLPHAEVMKNRDFYNAMPFAVKPLCRRFMSLLHWMPWLAGMWLRRRQKQNRYDLWQLSGAYPGGACAALLSGLVPTVVRTHGRDIQKDLSIGFGMRLVPWMNTRIEKTLPHASAVIAMTEKMAQCCDEVGVAENRIIRIANGFDLKRLQRNPAKESQPKQDRNVCGITIPTDTLLILTVGRFQKVKGQDLIPPAAALLKKQGIRFCWLLVGRDTDKLDERITENDVGDCVFTRHEIGPHDNRGHGQFAQVPDDALIALYHMADICVCPSRLEGFPRVVGEAMASGSAVVTTDAPGCADLVQDGVSGIVVRAGDPQALATGIEKLASDSKQRETLASAAEKAAASFDFETITRQYEDLYHSLSAGKA